MEFRLFGPVEIWSHGSRIDLGPTKTRLLLAVLLMEAGGTVPVDTIIRRVWDEEVPAKVTVSLHASVSRLRRRLAELGDDGVRLEHVSPIGYRLLAPPETVDVLEFNRMVVQGQVAAGNASRDRSICLLQKAESLVRGEPLAGLPGPWAQAARAGLLERRHAAALTRIKLLLELEDPRSLLAELRELAANHPLDETVASLLMRALDGAGRTGDALDVYRATRQRLRTQLGVDPHRPLNDTHQAILRGDSVVNTQPTKTATDGIQTVPNTLDHDPPIFVGRDQDIDSLLRQIDARLRDGRPAVCVVDGMPGVGKTTLALRLAHLLRDRCPGGALQLHLRGHDPMQPPTPAHVLLPLLLNMLGTESRELQRNPGMDHLISQWRRHTSTRNLLVFLDDAVDEQQVLPLIPSGQGSIVLVTSRHRLADLPDAIHHSLRLMPLEDAQLLFTRVAQVTNEQQGTLIQRIVKTCGRLPLALSVTAGFLRARPSWSVEDLADHLSHALDSDGTDTISKRLDATFDTSYRNLPDLQRRVLRRLALHPSTKINLHAAAALAGTGLAETDTALDLLVEHHLLTEPQRHRYRMHDLLRGFASHVLTRDEDPGERQAASDRFVRYLLDTTEQATKLFHPHGHANLTAASLPSSNVEALRFSDAQSAAVWLDDEQATLRSQAEYWHSHGHAREAAALSHMLAMYFDRRGLWRESVPLHENALHTWVRIGDVAAQAHTLCDLATVRWRLGALDQARFCSETALTLWQGLDNAGRQAEALLLLGRAHHYAHEQDKALACYSESASLCAAAGDRVGQADAYYHRGVVLFDKGRHEDGISDTRKALDLARALNDVTIERNCVNNLGEFHRQRGEYEQALECYRKALALAEQVGDPRNIAVAALNLGEISNILERPDEALASINSALEIFTRLGSQSSVANALLAQVRAYEQLGKHDRAVALLSDAAAIAEQLADPRLSAHVHLTAGAMYEGTGEHERALASYRSALSEGRVTNALLDQAVAHHGIGNVLTQQRHLGSAKVQWHRALDIYCQLHLAEAEILRTKLTGTEAAEAQGFGGLLD